MADFGGRFWGRGRFRGQGLQPKSNHMRFVHCCTCCEIPPSPPLAKGGTESAPFQKGGRAPRGGIFVGRRANLVWSDLAAPLLNNVFLSRHRSAAQWHYVKQCCVR
jgi:hypothetical protein